MVQWKFSLEWKGTYYWRYTHFCTNDDGKDAFYWHSFKVVPLQGIDGVFRAPINGRKYMGSCFFFSPGKQWSYRPLHLIGFWAHLVSEAKCTGTTCFRFYRRRWYGGKSSRGSYLWILQWSHDCDICDAVFRNLTRDVYDWEVLYHISLCLYLLHTNNIEVYVCFFLN